MRTVKISHEPLPGIGERFDLAARSGLGVTVVSERAGRSISRSDPTTTTNRSSR